MNKTADTILVNGNIITLDNDVPFATAIAIKNGVITYVGDNQGAYSFKGDSSQIMDVKGKTVLPSFIESHMHPLVYGTSLLEVDCRPHQASSIDQLLKKIQETAEKTPKGQWVRGWGWDDSRLLDNRMPTRWDLDKVAPHHPVYLKRTCAHMSVVNSKALELCGIDKQTPNPEGGLIVKDPASGELTGLLQENAQNLITLPAYTKDDLKKGMKLAQQDFSKWGITTVHDMAVTSQEFKTYQEMLQANELDVRVRMWFWALDGMSWTGIKDEVIGLGIQSGFGNPMLNVQGIKYMLDGSVGGRTAAVAEAFENDPDNYGILYTTENELTPHVVESIQSGLRVAIHAIGERAIEVAMKAFESAAEEKNILFMRNRIEHCTLPTDSHLQRMKQLNLIAASSVGFLYHIGDSYYHNLGPERMKRVYPHHTFKEYGIVAPGNSDLPIVDGNPILGIYGAVSRETITGQILDNVQNISVLDAIHAYTSDAAYSGFDETIIGSIKKNKYADVIVLSEDPTQVPVSSIKDIEVQLTMMNGKITHTNL